MFCDKCNKEIEKVEVVTKKLVIQRLNDCYYEFNSEKVNEEFRKDLKTINYDLREANLYEADLREANLSEADLSEANLSEADLSKADLSEANLWKADLWKADLWKADLSKADLREAELNCVFYNTIVTEEQRDYIMTKTDLFTVKEE